MSKIHCLSECSDRRDRALNWPLTPNTTTTTTIMALQRARNQQSKSVALSRNYRKRRKACYEDLSSLKTPTFLQSSVLLIVLAISWVGVYAFLLQPGRHPSRPLVARSTQTRVVPTYHQQVATPLFFAANDGGGQSDDEEWKAMLAAFQMYKAAYGNLKVPLRFTVPSLAPWPGQHVFSFTSLFLLLHLFSHPASFVYSF